MSPAGYLRFSAASPQTRAHRIRPPVKSRRGNSAMAGTVIYEAHPAMFRAHPWWFIGCIILIPVFGLGVLLLLYWYIHTRQTALTVTDAELLYERGILSKDRTSVSLKHVRARDARLPEPHPGSGN